MATPQDQFTQLNPGSGGDQMDESAPLRQDGATRKRARVVLTGDAQEGAVLDLQFCDGVWCLPVSNPVLNAENDKILALLSAINAKLAKIAGVLP